MHVFEDAGVLAAGAAAANQSHGEDDVMHFEDIAGTDGPSPALSVDVGARTAALSSQPGLDKAAVNGKGSPLSEQTGGERGHEGAARCAPPPPPQAPPQLPPPPPPLQLHADLRVPPTHGLTADKFSKLSNLALLFEQGFILETEYKERRSQLIDELTGTKSTGLDDTNSSSVTGSTAASTNTRKVRRMRRRARVSSSIVVPRPPPSNFEVIPAERAIKHFFNLSTRSWHTEEVFVRIDDTPFARGGLRLVYHLQEVPREEYRRMMEADGASSEDEDELLSHFATTISTVGADNCNFALVQNGALVEEDEEAEATSVAQRRRQQQQQQHAPSDEQQQQQQQNEDENEDEEQGCKEGGEEGGDEAKPAETNSGKPRRTRKTTFVAKIAIDPNEDPSTYFRDVEAQAHCAQYAKLFNSYSPPRTVEFVKAWILELTEREGRPLCAIERFISGSYKKHNNNYGYVSEDERNTPQAFSHFSYEASARTMLVVDIQGVGDSYTDPQLHTLNQDEFGKGNLGIRGFHKFLSTHRCNRICRYLKLPPVNPRYNTAEGTIPNLPFMPATKINRSHFKEGHYFESTPALRQLVKQKARARKQHKRRKAGGEHQDEHNDDDDEHDNSDEFLATNWDSSGSHTEEGYCNFGPFAACNIL